ncbi:MAG: hypothetical protein K1Y36_27445 [Blastocatellia bacterium]|nr:hypothetical protein [Blastocatellia bacterium]
MTTLQTDPSPCSPHLLALYRRTVVPAHLPGWVAGAAAWQPPAHLRDRVLAAYDCWQTGSSRRWWRMQGLALIVMATGLVLMVSSLCGEATRTETPLTDMQPDGILTVPTAAAVLPLDVGQPSTPTRHSQGSTENLEEPAAQKKNQKQPTTRMQSGNPESGRKTHKQTS